MNVGDAPFDSKKSYESVACHAAAVTPSDATVLPMFRSLHIGTAGLVTVRMHSGAVVQHNAPQGPLSVCGDKVLATGTTASQIVAWY